MSGDTPPSRRRTARRDERAAARASSSRRSFLRTVGTSAAVGGIGVAGATRVAAQADESTATDEVTATETAPETDSNAAVDTPSNVAIDDRGPTSIEVTWDGQYAVALDGWELRWVDARPPDVREAPTPSDPGSKTVDADASSTYVDGLTPGVPYRITVRAVDDEGRETAPAEVEGRARAVPMGLRVADFEADEVTVEWDPAWDGWDGFPYEEYAVELGGEVVERVGTDVGSATIPGVSTEEIHRVTVYGADADGQQTLGTELSFRIGTDAGPGLERYIVTKPELYAEGVTGDRPTVSVDGREVTAEGSVWVFNQGCTIGRISHARLADGVARIAVDNTRYSSSCFPAEGRLSYRTTLVFDAEPEYVVLEHRLEGDRTIWQGGEADGTVGVAIEDGHLEAGETTEAAIRVHGDAVDVGEYGLDVSIDRSVAEVASVSVPDGVEGSVSTPEVGSTATSDDDSAVTLTASAGENPLSTADGPATLATLELTAVEPGRTAVDVGSIDASGPGGEPLDLGALGTSLQVGLPPVGDNENAPTDPDDDGLYEDVNGNGEGDLADAVDLFQHREDEAVTNNAAAYDFSGNEEVDLADVVQLFDEL